MTQLSSLPPAASRAAGLARLRDFQPAMGGQYAAKRNYDLGPDRRDHVACLSPHVRHRLLQEEELARAALDAHGFQRAEKFVQEVCWRTYWKGWLEMRPSAWPDYRTQLDEALEALDKDRALAERWRAACAGETGIEPWTLGADFFIRHLLDGDPASNTLSWRWIVGLQTPGKTYLARASNINKFTDGRFRMQGYELAPDAPALDPELRHPEPAPLRAQDVWDAEAPSALLLTDEDLHPESWGVERLDIRAVYAVSSLEARSPMEPGDRARAFTEAALGDGLARARERFGVAAELSPDPADAARRAAAAGFRQLVVMRPAAGPLRDLVDAARPHIDAAGVTLVERVRLWDRAFHPHAAKGFFKLKEKIPAVLSELGLT